MENFDIITEERNLETIVHSDVWLRKDQGTVMMSGEAFAQLLTRGSKIRFVCPECGQLILTRRKHEESQEKYERRMEACQEGMSKLWKGVFLGKKRGKKISIYHNDCYQTREIRNLSLELCSRVNLFNLLENEKLDEQLEKIKSLEKKMTQYPKKWVMEIEDGTIVEHHSRFYRNMEDGSVRLVPLPKRRKKVFSRMRK